MRNFVLFFLFCSILQINAQSRRTTEENTQRRSGVNDTSVLSKRQNTRLLFAIPGGPAEIPEEKKTKEPGIPQLIMGKGEIGVEQLVSFLLEENKDADRAFVETLAALYVAEAEREGVNHDIAFVQMCLETGFLRFGGLVIPEMNNFCGLGAIGAGITGEWFPTAELGVRAHIQHLQAYATDQPLQGELADPRYHFVRRGSSPSIQGLAGSWAADKLYAEKIEGILQRLYRAPKQQASAVF